MIKCRELEYKDILLHMDIGRTGHLRGVYKMHEQGYIAGTGMHIIKETNCEVHS